MEISRKDFFRKGLLSLGKTALEIAGTLHGSKADECVLPPDGTQPAEPHPDMVAWPHNEYCLARNCGCFACSERCQTQAILILPGEGIRIDEARCTGCGSCEYVCPATPKAIILKPRPLSSEAPSMKSTIPQKGESPC